MSPDPAPPRQTTLSGSPFVPGPRDRLAPRSKVGLPSQPCISKILSFLDPNLSFDLNQILSSPPDLQVHQPTNDRDTSPLAAAERAPPEVWGEVGTRLDQHSLNALGGVSTATYNGLQPAMRMEVFAQSTLGSRVFMRRRKKTIFQASTS